MAMQPIQMDLLNRIRKGTKQGTRGYWSDKFHHIILITNDIHWDHAIPLNPCWSDVVALG